MNDIAICKEGQLVTSKNPLKLSDVYTVGTKNYVFFIPKKTIGIYVILHTFKTHSFFQDKSIEEGMELLISESESVESLEKELIEMLEGNSNFIHQIVSKNTFKFGGFLGKITLRMNESKTVWASVTLKGDKAMAKAFKAFYS